MPGLLTHNLMPEDREDEPQRAPMRAPGPSLGYTAVACSEHRWASYSDGSRRCSRCFAITYPQGRLF